MFSRKKQAGSVDKTDTVIGEGTIVEGKIVTEASMLIEGTVSGEIQCAGDVTVGEKGVVRSTIEARSILNAGVIEGAVKAKGKITITSKGRIEGSISAGSLRVAEGGILMGECIMDLSRGGELKSAKEKKQQAESNVKQATA